nr:putative ribonuclease H-like domain-containing protein [Tanacetum cinerariifolium]
VDHGSSWAKNNNTHKSRTPRTVFHKTGRLPMRTNRPYMNAAQPKRTSFYKPAVRSQFRGNKGTAVKASACWIWKPSQNLSNKGNISYLFDYEPFDGGYVSFGQGGCKITGKGTIKTVTDDFSRFTWTFFLKTKDETSGILRNFIIEIENLKELRVKIIRYDNEGEFRNKEMNDFCSRKGIKREFSNARTPQQNGVA